MVKVLLYGCCTRVASSRRMAQRLHGAIAFRALAASNTSDSRTISDFRKDRLKALSGLFQGHRSQQAGFAFRCKYDQGGEGFAQESYAGFSHLEGFVSAVTCAHTATLLA